MFRPTARTALVLIGLLGALAPRAAAFPAQPPEDRPVLLRFRHQPGDRGLVAEENTVRMKIKADEETLDLIDQTKMDGVEEVLEVEKGLPSVVRKDLTGFSTVQTDPKTGKRSEVGPIREPVRLRVDYGVDPTSVEVIEGTMPKGLEESLTKPKAFLRLIPSAAVKVGETFAPNDRALAAFRDELAPEGVSVKSLKVTLKLDGLAPYPIPDGRAGEGKERGKPAKRYVFDAATIDVSLRYEAVYGGNLPLTLDAKGKGVFAPSAGILLAFDLEGTFSIKPTEVESDGRRTTVSGEGSARTRYRYNPIDWTRGLSTAAEPREPEARPESGERPKPKARPEPDRAEARPKPAAGSAADGPAVLFEPREEPREKAFTFLVPKGWVVEGGVFNVDPLKANGPGNTIAPKCDLTVKRDEAGTVMLRWLPSWNYADLSLSPMGPGLFKPGMAYQGMPVRPLASPRDYLLDVFRSNRPRATGMRVVAEDPIPELVEAYRRRSEGVNQQLARIGLPPMSAEAVGLVVEYSDDGRAFREVLLTTVVDARGSAFMWSNSDTIAFRAPKEEFPAWKRVLDTIQSSRRMNPRWVDAVTRAMGERARIALETQDYVNGVLREIAERRSQAQSRRRYEDWLFMTGQEEYKNPFDGQTELGTSEYRYRWVCSDGRILYTDDNVYDPNQTEEFKSRTWKRSPVRPR